MGTVQKWLGKDNEIGMAIWENKYRHNNETFDEWLDRVSGGDEELRQLIKEKRFLFGGRALTSRGTNSNASMYNCYSRGFIEDDMKDITQSWQDIALTFKAQGGQGVSLSKIRPKGAKIGESYESDGIIPFMKIYNSITEGTSQGGARKGAIMISLDCRHKEVEDFIKIKSNDSEITKANLSLEVDDIFMSAVEKYYKSGEEVVLHERREYGGKILEYEITPIKIFKLLCKTSHEWAEPAILYTERFRNYNIMEKVDGYNIETSNPCFTGDMKLLTSEGYKTFEELNGRNDISLISYDGKISKNNKVWCNGEKETISVNFYNNDSIECTPDHVFMLSDGTECLAKDLKGKRIALYKCNDIEYDVEYIKYGFIQGDGNLKRLASNYHRGFEVNLGQDDDNVRKLFQHDTFTNKNHRAIYLQGYKDILIKLGFSPKNLKDRIFPNTFSDWNVLQKLSFLRGVFSANGCVVKNHRVQYKTICKELSLQLQEALYEFGINSNITTNLPTVVSFKNGSYLCKQSYDICINQYKSIVKFYELIGFVHEYKNKKLEDLIRLKSPFVRSITPSGTQKVYDFTENINHWGVVSGCVVHNCGEQPLPKNFSCNLGSINLYEMVTDKFAENANFDFKQLEKAVRIGVKALDDIIDENTENHALEEQKNNSLNYRNIGLGVFGYADMLVALNMTYGSDEALEFSKKLFEKMFVLSIEASSNLAKSKGSFPMYTDDVWNSEIIRKHFSQNKINVLKECGLRNCSLLSIAPTGSISTMLGRSGGVEPIFAVSHKRKTESLHDGEDVYYDVYCETAKDYKKETQNNTLTQHFIEASNIYYIKRILTQSVIQNHIDTAISSTVNLPNSATVEDIENIYLQAWKARLKGITVYRQGCKRGGILTDNTQAESHQEVVKPNDQELRRGIIIKPSDDLLSRKRTITNGCGKFYLHTDFDEFTGDMMETFIDIGGHGGCEKNLQFISRLMSLLLRAGVPIEEIIDQAKSIRPCVAYMNRTWKKGDTSKGTSCPSAIGFGLEELNNSIQDLLFANYDDASTEKDEVEESQLEECPECKEKTLCNANGCVSCMACGYSKCN